MKAKEEAQMGHLDRAELAGGPVTDGASSWESRELEVSAQCQGQECHRAQGTVRFGLMPAATAHMCHTGTL